jgi:hypothetical protein
MRNKINFELEEEEDIRPEVWIKWPDGTKQRKLTSKQGGLVWQHAHRGHEKPNKDCYACVCEDAY